MNAIEEKLKAITEPENIIVGHILDDGTIEYKNLKGQFHSIDDFPARIESDGSKYWYKNNKLHRDNSLPAVIEHGYKQYWENGERIYSLE